VEPRRTLTVLPPLETILALKPDVLVKGGDWKKHQIAGRAYAKKVVRIPLIKGRSTTDLIRRIAQRYAGQKKTA